MVKVTGRQLGYSQVPGGGNVRDDNFRGVGVRGRENVLHSRHSRYQELT